MTISTERYVSFIFNALSSAVYFNDRISEVALSLYSAVYTDYFGFEFGSETSLPVTFLLFFILVIDCKMYYLRNTQHAYYGIQIWNNLHKLDDLDFASDIHVALLAFSYLILQISTGL